MVARIYTANDTLTITAFPFSDDVGYAIRVGENDVDGAYLGSVFPEEGSWVAYGPEVDDGEPVILGSSSDLDDLVRTRFLSQLRLGDALDE